VVDYLDRSIKGPDEVKPLLNVPALGIIHDPSSKSGTGRYANVYGYYKDTSAENKKGAKPKNLNPRNIELINFVDPECPFAESYRSIRTSILLSTPKKPPQVITVTSAQPSEGKTVTIANLAVSFSQLGKKVLIVDADMRKPRINKVFKLKNTVGLSTFLVGKAELTDIIQKTHIPNVFVITSGPIPPNPVELIDSDIMQHLLVSLQEKVDFIFIDTPPLIGIVDPIIMGRYADGMILVAWGGKTHRNHVIKAKEEIDQYNIRVLGVVLNRVDLRRLGYGYNYYGKYKYQYKYKETDYRKHMR
jgi:capsular exopolysaccharide synthesis family protein